MCDVGRSGIGGDPRKAYYCKVEKLSNIYGTELGLGGAYGHKLVNDCCMSWFDGVGWCNVMVCAGGIS